MCHLGAVDATTSCRMLANGSPSPSRSGSAGSPGFAAPCSTTGCHRSRPHRCYLPRSIMPAHSAGTPADTDAAVRGSDAAIALDLLTGPLSFLLGFQAKTDILEGRQVKVRLVTTDPDRVLGLALGPKAELGESAEDADAMLTAPAEAIIRLLAGRLGPAHTPDTVSLTGGGLTLDQLRKVFPGY